MINFKTPGGTVPGFYCDILKQPHVLIAGATGSGKSVILNGVIYTLMHYDPLNYKIIAIDPKRVELTNYKNTPHTIAHATEPREIVKILQKSIQIMEERFKRMQRAGLVKSDEADIYIIIDEYADLMTTNKKEVTPLIIRLSQLGRAAKIHLILATQRPTRDIITGQIKVNLDTRIALRCPSTVDSRNIIERKGAERLPRYGYGYYMKPEGLTLEVIPMIPDDDIDRLIRYWQTQTPKLYKFFKNTL